MCKKISVEIALERLKDKAPLLDISTYNGWKNKARFVDPHYGEWFTLPKYVFDGHEHPKRANAQQGIKRRLSLEEILIRLGDKASWLDVASFMPGNNRATFNHPEFGQWITNISTVIAGHNHPKAGKRNAVALNITKYGRAINHQHTIKENLSGKKFGHFTVISLYTTSPVKWLIRCECGAERIKSTNNTKRSTSCGCLTKESRLQRANTRNGVYIGKTYGKWTVIGLTDRSTYFQCKCDCGTVRDVYRHSLFGGISTNCGCVTPIFKTEELCRAILEQHSNKKWPKRRIFKNPETGAYLELDGYCEELKLAFEYDGEQHFKESAFGSGDDTLKERQHRDDIKNNLCYKHGIRLIRIPYTMKESLNPFIKESLKRCYCE